MSDRVANIIVLCEDQEHEILIRRYLQKIGQPRTPRVVPLIGKNGSGAHYVRTQFPKQVAICRGILGRRTRCVLIAITDADNLTVQQRERSLMDELGSHNQPAIQVGEPIVILIPKWQVETWVKCLLGQTMSEDGGNSDRPPISPKQIANAIDVLYEWTRNGAAVGSTCVPSLRSALPRLQMLENLHS